MEEEAQKDSGSPTESKRIKLERIVIPDSSPNSSSNTSSSSSSAGNTVPCSILRYHRNDENMPVIGEDNPEKDVILKLCLEMVPEKLVCRRQPKRLKEACLFLIDQVAADVKHPFDFDGCESLSSARKSCNVRWYKVTMSGGKIINVSTAIEPKKQNGLVVGGIVKDREGAKYKDKNLPACGMYAIIRRRAEDKAFKERGIKFVRTVTFVMTRSEYNIQYKKLMVRNRYKLETPRVLVHYAFNGDAETFSQPRPHGNSKNRKTFVPRTHSFLTECKDNVEVASIPRFVIDEFDKRDNILSRKGESSFPRNAKQITNMKSAQRKNSTENDDLLSIFTIMMNSPEIKYGDAFPIDEDQPYCRELKYESGGQPMYVLYLDQSLVDIARFGVVNTSFPPTPVAVDVTFNIAEYKVTETTYKNFMVKRLDNDKHPWFPGPAMIHRRERFQDFQFFWQSVTRRERRMEHLALLGSDECKEMYQGICSVAKDATVLLGIEHVEKNILQKLDDLRFPNDVQRVIKEDCFGASGLIECSSLQLFDDLLPKHLAKWDELGRSHVKNYSNEFSIYFAEHKTEVFRNHMIKAVREKVKFSGEYRQNCIEWSHYMTKSEIDMGLKDSHKTASLVEVITRMKHRNLRMYRDVIKSIYGESDKYRLSDSYRHFLVPRDVWEERDENERRTVTAMLFSQEIELPVEKDVEMEGKTVVNNTEPSPQRQTVTSSIEPSVQHEPHVSTADPAEVVKGSRFPVSCHSFIESIRSSVPLDLLPEPTIVSIFKDAEHLINTNGVMMAASKDPKMRQVKSTSRTAPHLVSTKGKNQHFYHCDCAFFVTWKFCSHALAAAVFNNDTLHYLMEVIKKRKDLNKGSSLSAGIDAARKISERGLKDNEVAKLARKKRAKPGMQFKQQPSSIRPPIPPVSSPLPQSSNSNGQQIPPPELPTPTQQISCSQPLSSSMQPLLPSTQPQEALHHSLSIAPTSFLYPSLQQPVAQPNFQYTCHPSAMWNSSMSPHPYELVEKPGRVSVCYGCGRSFDPQSDYYVVKHVDRRARGRNSNGAMMYNQDFTAAYYHPDPSHIKKKNPVFNGSVNISTELSIRLGKPGIDSFIQTTGLHLEVVT